MTLDPECKDCLYNSQIKKVEREQKDESALCLFRREVKKLCENPPKDYCAPLLMRDIDRVHRRIFGTEINYAAEKLAFNSAVLSIEDSLYDKISCSADPFAEAVKYAAAANYIDFAKLSDLDESSLQYVETAAERTVVNQNTLAQLKDRIASSDTLLYIHDNCGEIVFDKIFIRLIKKFYPRIKVTSLVRGGDIINDCTLKDAEYVGLSSYADIAESGAAVPGTYLKEVNERTLSLLSQSGVIISKGLGNLETLFGEGYDIFYIFMCKCKHIARRFGCNQWEVAFVREGF